MGLSTGFQVTRNELLILVTRHHFSARMDCPSSPTSSSSSWALTSSAGYDAHTRRRQLFGDCALIEIIHLHDCLRGALKALESDVTSLQSAIRSSAAPELEKKVAGRFKVIWSVFQSHSQAEDEFIWPALKDKTQGKVIASCNCDCSSKKNAASSASTNAAAVIEQEEYEEDHADEERMFSAMDGLLTQIRYIVNKTINNKEDEAFAENLAQQLCTHAQMLSQHLMAHLEKEESQCMPLVVKHLSKSEIHDLVGKIMGKRSADTIANIMTMAVQNLDQADRLEMVKYMKQSMAGTFFDRWLTMSGWMPSVKTDDSDETEERADIEEEKKRPALPSEAVDNLDLKRARAEDHSHDHASCITENSSYEKLPITSPGELEKLIRAIASNPSLTPAQKNTTIQGLRDSVWKHNQKLRSAEATVMVNVKNPPTDSTTPHFLSLPGVAIALVDDLAGSTAAAVDRSRRNPPSMYFKRNNEGKVVCVWTSESPSCDAAAPPPLFSASELAPTYHDGAAGAVLGCPHYARACKLRHPVSGKLYTCRLCCQQQRELPMKEQDVPLDRYAVTEIMCMKCNALQPAEDRCFNTECESRGKPFARYFCRICHLYDDGTRPIFHCPYCNCCRLGKGLGIDFRHCMRCNACVSLSDTDHRCIPQKLQGDCPICNEMLFQSTEPLRGLKCGHVMHLSCFSEYRRGHAYTCPLCMRSMEDMKDYFALLDMAVRMQPMPAAYLGTMSNIYCQDCGKTGQTKYHFVGQKCPHCGSYNTREMGRVHMSPRSSPTTAES